MYEFCGRAFGIRRPAPQNEGRFHDGRLRFKFMELLAILDTFNCNQLHTKCGSKSALIRVHAKVALAALDVAQTLR